MNRQFEFRAWHKKEKVILYGLAHHVFIWQVEGQPIVIMQSTGLYDKNGGEIYEGDIVKHVTHIDGNFVTTKSEKHEVVWLGTGFTYRPIEDRQYKQYTIEPIGGESIEIIGNIYQNPELVS